MVFPGDGELDAVSLSNFHVFTVSLPENTLQETALEITGADWEALRDRREIVRGTADRMERLRGLATVCVRLSHENRPHQGSSQRMDASDHEAEIANLLVEIVSAARRPTRPPARTRETIIRRSLEYIRAREDEPPSISALCVSAGASRRAVEYAFREHFGASPKAYILARRLESVRGELKISDREASITHVANRWGFHHLSHFAALYKRHFGELPSETRRASQRGGSRSQLAVP
jgi:AraC family ethanolamine operon transcriptional activator